MRKEAVNPKMEILKVKGSTVPFVDEKVPAKMPDVKVFPTGKKAAKKVQIGMG